MSNKRLILASSALAAVAALGMPSLAAAQEAIQTSPQEDVSELDEIVVTGIRASQEAAIEIKRDNIAVVDSIAAEDLGKLPDQNVAESLQRIAGVTIERNRGEGRYVSVRGFGPRFNAVTVNGRTLATDNAGREFSFDVIPSEIIAGADVYKSPQANIMGASIGGTIDIRTLRPLDRSGSGFEFAGSLGTTWNELLDRYNPEASGVVSWRNEDRNMAFALSASYAEQDMRDDEFTIGAGHVYRSSGDSYYRRNGVVGGRIGPNVAPFEHISMPSNLSPFFFEREKTMAALNGVFQWRPADNLTVTVDGLFARAEITEQQTGLAYDFAGGTLVEQVVQGQEAVYQRYEGGFVDQIIQYDQRNVDTTQFGLNLEWNPTDDLTLTFDASRSEADKTSDGNNHFTTIRRKGVDLWWDRRDGNAIYEYGFNYPGSTADAATDPDGITAHYYIWGGSSDINDTIDEYRFDAEWAPLGNVTVYGGLGYQHRVKDIVGRAMPFGQQCAYCDSNEIIPASYFQSTNRDFFGGQGGDIIHDWLIYDPLALIEYVAGLAARDGRAFAPAVYDPASSSVVDEEVIVGYVMADIEADLGGMPLAVNFGVRVESTDYTSTGASRTVLSARPNEGGQNVVVLSDVIPVHQQGDYVDILPSINARLDLTDNLVLRGAASRVMTRPTLSDLSPRMSIQTNPGNETIRRGNPDLDPFRASQFELGLEWYFHDASMLSATAFYKNIDSFVTLVTTPQVVDQITFQVTQPANGEGAVVKGFEVLYRQAFDNLPYPWNGLGAQASFAFTDSDAEYFNAVTNLRFGLEGLSKYSYSLIGYYEEGPIQARLAYTWRDGFVQTASGRNGEPEYFDAYGQLDAGFSYEITDNYSVYLDAINLTDEDEFLYSVTPNRTKEFRTTGRRVSAGLRVRF